MECLRKDAAWRDYRIAVGDSKRAPELKRVLKSLQSAKRMSLQSKDRTVELMVRTLKVDRETAEEAYGEYRKTVSGNGVPTREGIEQIIKSVQLLGQFLGRKIAFEEVADARIARESCQGAGLQSRLSAGLRNLLFSIREAAKSQETM